LLLVWALPGHTGKQGREIAALWETIADRVAALPGVTSASVSIEGLLNGSQRGGPLMTVEGRDVADSVRIQSTSTVSPGFFATVGQRLVSGREFARTDSDSSQSVVIINRTLAVRLFGSTDAVGHRVLLRGVSTPFTVIGVVADAKQTPRTPNGPAVYYPPRQNLNRLARGMCVIVRTTANPSAVGVSVRRTLAEVDGRLPILNIDTIDEQLSRTLFQERLVAALSIAFGALALLLSCVGLYGVVSYVTIRRTKEIGVRMALGASRQHVLADVLHESIGLVVAGIVIGASVGAAVARGVEAQLFGVRSTDPRTMVQAAVLLLVVAGIAALIPALRAARVNPVIALRHDKQRDRGLLEPTNRRVSQ
jgi:predicted permease